MIRTLIIFLPLFVSVLWLPSHRLFFSRSDTNYQLMALMFFLSLFLFYDCCYADPGAPYNIQALSILVAQASTPCLVPLIIIYLRKLRGTSTRYPLQMLWIIAPVVLFTSATLLYLVAGPSEIETALQNYYAYGNKALEAYKGTVVYLFFISAFGLYRITNYCMIVWLIIYLIVYKVKGHFKFADICRFFFKGGEVNVRQLQMFNISVVFFFLVAKTPVIKDVINSHQWLLIVFAIFVSVFVYWFSYVAMFASRRTIRSSDLPDGWRYNYGADTREEVETRMIDSLLDDVDDDTLVRIQERIGKNKHVEEWHSAHGPFRALTGTLSDLVYSGVSGSYEEHKLLPALQTLMLEEQPFLQPRITLAEVAEMLGSNTTYVSRLVNNAYHLGFPEFINSLRVRYAQQFILEHRDAKQDEIALKSGFLSASSFNNIFKKIVGTTPKAWLAGVDRITMEAENKRFGK